MRRMLYLSYWIFMQANMATATASEWVPARQTPNAIYCVPPTLHSPPCPPLTTSSLSTWTWVFRPKCSLLYNTHNYRQIEATNSLATHTYEELARSLMQTTPPISGQRPPTQRALMWQLQHQQQQPRPRYAHEAGHGQAALPPPFYLLLLCQATPLQFSTTPCPRQPLVSRHAVASRGSCRCGWVTATATATLQHF